MPNIVFFLIFFLVRLINLGQVPILNDEGIYLHWGSQFYDSKSSIKFNFIAADGKQTGVPLLFGLVQMLPFDPVILGRATVAVLSFITFISILFVQKQLFPKSPNWSLALMLIFCPYLLFYDRAALPDSIVSACFNLAFLITLSNRYYPSRRKNIFLGACIAVGWWFKSTALLAFPAIFAVYIYEFSKRKINFTKTLFIFFEVLFSFLIFIFPLILQPAYWQSPMKDIDRLVFSGNSNNQILIWIENGKRIFQWFIGYITPLALIQFSIAVIYRKKNLIYPLFVFTIPLILVLLMLKSIMEPRWIVFLVPVLLLLIHEAIYILPKYKNILLVSILGPMVFFSIVQITNPLAYYELLNFVPLAQKGLAFTGWSSGFGVKESADFLKKLSQENKIIVFISAASGNPEDGIYTYLKKAPNIKVMGDINYTYLVKNKQQYLDLIKSTDFYYVSRGNNYSMLKKDELVEIKKFKKPLDGEFVGLYRIKID